jgi:hypothetical protein
LEKCVADLQAQNNSPTQPPPPTITRQQDEDDEDDDEEMEDDEEPSSSTPVTAAQDRSGSMVSLPSLSSITSNTTSPSIFSAGRHYSVSSTSQASYSPYFHSTHTSPAFGPQLSHISNVPVSAGPHRDTFGLGSPALKPLDHSQQLRHMADSTAELSEKRPVSAQTRRSEHELDQEAAAALSMLNNDRRNWSRAAGDGDTTRPGNGMSVRDLLSG